MTTNKFLTLDSSAKEVFTQGVSTSAGVADANKLVSTGATGKIDATLLPATTGTNSETIVAFENLSAGAFVNLFTDGDTVRKCRLADASNNRPAHGYVTASATAAGNATVNFTGNNDVLTGLTVGTRYFLSTTTPGSYVATPSLTSTHIIQCLGVAISTTAIRFEYDDPITVA